MTANWIVTKHDYPSGEIIEQWEGFASFLDADDFTFNLEMESVGSAFFAVTMEGLQ